MSDYLESGIVQGVLATLIGVLVLGIIGWLKFRRDERIVTEFLKNSGIETPHISRTTQAISSATHLSKERIGKVCSKSTMIGRCRKEKGSWKLS
jgi:hypothetical protein